MAVYFLNLVLVTNSFIERSLKMSQSPLIVWSPYWSKKRKDMAMKLGEKSDKV
jgi:hypothetical protein